MCSYLLAPSSLLVGPIAVTTSGRVQGRIAPLNDASRYSYAFLAIPYATPPVGEFRFQPPQPPKSWKGIRDATKFGAVCAQDLPRMYHTMKYLMGLPFEFDVTGISEDCLTLDVYTPSLSGQRPVMVFIHGGGFISGWSSMADMRVYAAKYNVVGVAIQYRLGALGFMSTEDNTVKGNMGFKDQILSLKWVQENIANFGGDPNQVTIFGESAGAWSVSLHFVSHMSNGLFNRAILMSGSAVGMPQLSPSAQPLQEAIKLANAIGCPNATTEELTNCLLRKPAMEIVNATTMSMEFNPVVDNEYFTDVPLALMEKGLFQKGVDLLAGFTFVEGFMLGQMFFSHVDITNLNYSSFRECVSIAYAAFMPGMTINPALIDEALKVYIKDSESPEQMTYALTKLVGDCIITQATYNTALKAMEFGHQKVYLYDFHGRPFYSNKPEGILADHGDDIIFAFGFSEATKSYGLEYPEDNLEEGQRIEDAMMQYFTSFAETGVPSGDGLPKWPELREENSYMQIGPVLEVKQNYQAEHMNYWLETFPALQAEAAENHDEL
ncbi:hypothetical protein CAPTEDRAFT_136943 [Capitella teleta]|uniref:Carboxylic ester hydrolase n=1 Tax=Capitella teleta TaxID=283909 RepID=R7U1X0_CAPTE|nr:hypothetical protein CAPTEDRAFT_136943 [Capitella teleta]|eukprot:ELT99984.1 hypothetical protein CAPTEDRAFT_136943 [Capitella teleta]